MALEEPGSHLARERLHLRACPERLWRLSPRKYPNPVHWSRIGIGRFDDPAARWGVCYAGEDLETALVEVFGDRWIGTLAGRPAPRRMDRSDLAAHNLCELTPSGPLVVVDLTKEGLVRIGADANLCVSPDYALTRRWSLALMEHPQAPRGLAYHSRHNPAKTNYAIFGDEGIEPTLQVRRTIPLGDHPDLFLLLDRYGVSAF